MKKIQKSEKDNKKQTWAKQKSESEFQNLKSSAKKLSKYTLENQRKENSKVYPKIAFTLSTIFEEKWNVNTIFGLTLVIYNLSGVHCIDETNITDYVSQKKYF